ncbi:hypothetical protein LQZ24_05330 [Fructobacillus sp. M1-13]|uniref:Uncharacterized protein n=1 Tax=Fructobacillus papyriferae TaxID=2713171 RepID=A0ABS5QPS4_9LACO|nr:hypothetical protein [Fructobacillus papyriferae]MBS9335096.1 hypothetical protein [Fructobacillus papyriferae]MCD2159418.1 hypothetical protein [Fructobacillus papyriferae]
MFILKRCERPAFVLAESLLALTVLTGAVLLEQSLLEQHRVQKAAAQEALKQALSEKERALKDWNQYLEKEKAHAKD